MCIVEELLRVKVKKTLRLGKKLGAQGAGKGKPLGDFEWQLMNGNRCPHETVVVKHSFVCSRPQMPG